MRIKAFKHMVSEIVGSLNHVHLYFALKGDEQEPNEYKILLAKIEDTNTNRELLELFRDSLSQRILVDGFQMEDEKNEVPALSTSDELAGRIFRFDYSDDEYPQALHLFRDFKIDKHAYNDYSVTEESTFDFKKHNLSSVFGYIVHLSSNKECCLLFMKRNNFAIMKRQKVLKILKQNNSLSMCDEDLIRLDCKAQLLRIGDETYVLDVATLENHLGLNQIIHKDAMRGLEFINNLGLVSNLELLNEKIAVGSPVAKKLAKLNRSSAVFAKSISKDEIIKFAKSKDELKRKFKYEETEDSDGNQDTKIVLKKSSINAFLTMMNDSFLTSELTDEFYEVHAKDNMGSSAAAKPTKASKTVPVGSAKSKSKSKPKSRSKSKSKSKSKS